MVKFLEWLFMCCVSLLTLLPVIGFFSEVKSVQTMEAVLRKVVLSEVIWGQILIIGLPLFGALCLAIISIVKKEISNKAEKETKERLTLTFQKDYEEAFKKGQLTAEYSFLKQLLADRSRDLAGVLSLLPFSYGDRKKLYISETGTSSEGSVEFVFVLAGPDGVGTKVTFPGIHVSLDCADAIHSSDRGYEIGPIYFFHTDTPVEEFKGLDTRMMSECIEGVTTALKRVEAILAGKAQPHSVVNAISNIGLRIEKRYIGKPPEIKIFSMTPSISPDPDRVKANADLIAESIVQATVDPVPPTEKVLSQYDLAKSKVSGSEPETTDGEPIPDSKGNHGTW